MADQFLVATQTALATVQKQMFAIAEQKNREIVQTYHPSSVVRTIDGVIAATDLAYTVYQVATLAQNVQRQASVIRYRYSYLDDVVAFALKTLKEKSPVGKGRDPHPGLYRDSHTVFVDGRAVTNVTGLRAGQIVHISNPVPYARMIEDGFSVPGHTYEDAAQTVEARFGNTARIEFLYMPVRFGSIEAYANSRAGQAAGFRRGGSPALRPAWLTRQPALQITAR
jgi:hypothetical protein